MLVADGVEAVTMRAIAEKIEYTPTAIYHHFRDKQALIRELVGSDFREFSAIFRKIARIEDPVERLRASGMAYVEFGLTHPSHYRVLFMTPSFSSEKAQILSTHAGNPEEDAYAFLKMTVAEGIAAGRYRPEFKDADLLSQVMWSGVHGLVSLHIAKIGGDAIKWRDARKTARALVDAAIRGVVRES